MPNRPEDQVAVGTGLSAAEVDEAKEARLARDEGVLRLAKELRRFDRLRAGSRGAEFPHDEAYTPGYHEGGVRFGFFNGREGAAVAPPEADAPRKPREKT